MLLCDRPHVKDVDFEAARLIVATASGLRLGKQQLVMGDEVPRGALNTQALQQVYEPPLRLVETVEYVRTDPNLVRACAARGVSLDETSVQPPPPVITDPPVNQDDARVMCIECGHLYPDPPEKHHSRKECKKNQKEK